MIHLSHATLDRQERSVFDTNGYATRNGDRGTMPDSRPSARAPDAYIVCAALLMKGAVRRADKPLDRNRSS